jgi:hypothetical protein
MRIRIQTNFFYSEKRNITKREMKVIFFFTVFRYSNEKLYLKKSLAYAANLLLIALIFFGSIKIVLLLLQLQKLQLCLLRKDYKRITTKSLIEMKANEKNINVNRLRLQWLKL